MIMALLETACFVWVIGLMKMTFKLVMWITKLILMPVKLVLKLIGKCIGV